MEGVKVDKMKLTWVLDGQACTYMGSLAGETCRSHNTYSVWALIFLRLDSLGHQAGGGVSRAQSLSVYSPSSQFLFSPGAVESIVHLYGVLAAPFSGQLFLWYK